jgi:transcriptional regulator with XRE-family HTH domain
MHTGTLGGILRDLRRRSAWTLKEMSARTGITASTLSRIEHDRATLGYAALVELSRRLGIEPALLFPGSSHGRNIKGRLSAERASRGKLSSAGEAGIRLLCADLRYKRMTPRLVSLRARSVTEAGGLTRHAGEEFLFVLKGRLEIHTECYAPAVMAAGDCIYFDASMGHACTVAAGCEVATLLSIRDDTTATSFLHATDT